MQSVTTLPIDTLLLRLLQSEELRSGYQIEIKKEAGSTSVLFLFTGIIAADSYNGTQLN